MKPVPRWWLVDLAENGDGTVTARYAYHDGKSINVVVPANKHGEYNHAELAHFARENPPPPGGAKP